MNIALLRHGYTVGNLYGAYIGRTDQPLCAEGKKALIDALRGDIYPPAEILYASPMLRCMQTAKILYPNCAPRLEADLRERDFGRLEGMNHREIIALPGFADWGRTPESMVFPEGEGWEEASARHEAAYQTVIAAIQEAGCQDAAVVCHGGTILSLMERHILPPDRHRWHCRPGGGYLLKVDPDTGVTRLLWEISL